MVGRPVKSDSRDKQYRVRLNEFEDKILCYVSEMTGKQKSEIFRNALRDYYNKVRILKIIQNDESDNAFHNEFNYCSLEHISLRRIIDCPHCGAANKCDFKDYYEASYEERQMGEEIIYNIDCASYECCKCGKKIHISGYICEYPAGAYNDEDIYVKKEEDYE